MTRLSGLVAVLVLAACTSAPAAGGSPTPMPAAETPSVFEQAQVEITTSAGSVVSVDVELAETDEARARGLMFRESLPPDAGMLLMRDRPEFGEVWMKDTLIPLSAAFFDADGRIVSIVDLEPCVADPCPKFGPTEAFIGVLEVNQGAFERWGVVVGDTVHLVD